MKLSLVVPCYNEAENVELFQQAVIQAFDGCGYDYEIVFIDDGKILAVGTHEELLRDSEDYRTMVELQKLDEEKEGM